MVGEDVSGSVFSRCGPIKVCLKDRPEVVGDLPAFPEAEFIVRPDVVATEQAGFSGHVRGFCEGGHAQ